MRIALGQINTTVGDMSGNVARMLRQTEQAAKAGAAMIVFPELSVNGYPPRDLVERPSFLKSTRQALAELAEGTRETPIAVVCGYISATGSPVGRTIYNAAGVFQGGRRIFEQHKMLLPSYDVFDECRYFEPSQQQYLWEFQGRKVALTICEDAWNDEQFWTRRLYDRDPVEELAQSGAEMIISLNASPYHMGKRTQRMEMFRAIARRHGVPLAYVNQVGGNDQLVFDGSSFVLSPSGEPLAQCRSFAEDLVVVDLEAAPEAGNLRGDASPEPEAVYEALVLGTRDYVRKCGFRSVHIGLSGGIDSALTAVIAVEALGQENVTGVAMPGPFSSDHSLTDAREMAERLGIGFVVCPIHAAYQAMTGELAGVFAGHAPDVTEENLQSRLRGATLMALSNKFGSLVLTTGNKSELAVGYCTLYGDMCGGLAVISDVPKTLVYTLSRIANRRHNGAIPENVFTKPPSAELRPDQKDTDSLPEYEVLDAILKAYVEDFASPAQIAETLGHPLELVRDIVRKVDRNEYKRQQAAPGLKVTTKAFGIGRRLPIAQRFAE